MKTTFLIMTLLLSVTTLAADPIRLYRLNCGHIDFKDLSYFSDTGDYDGKSGRMVDSCFLVKHPKGWLMWDTGLSETLIGKPQTNVIGAKETVELTIEAQLKQIGLILKDINYLSVSHFHADHSGNGNLFKDASWILQKKEINYATAKPAPIGVIPEFFSALKSVKKIEVDGDYDVFQDGKVKLLFAPGHTPGHQVLSVELEKSGTVILAGDLYHLKYSRDHKLVPVFNPSRADTLASINRIERYAKVKKARVFIQHDPESSKKFPALPGFLD